MKKSLQTTNRQTAKDKPADLQRQYHGFKTLGNKMLFSEIAAKWLDAMQISGNKHLPRLNFTVLSSPV